MTVAVITVVSGRHDHLRAQRRHLAESVPVVDLHVVVAVDDLEVDDVVAECPGLPTTVIHHPTTRAGLPVAAARNIGARAALCRGAEVIIFLDVDCIPRHDLAARLTRALAARPDALVCGTVTYLPPAPDEGWTARSLSAARRPHPSRPDPPPDRLSALSPALFWSLCCAATAQLWTQLGGFYAGYVGYGGEDTDLAASATRAGTAILMVGGADAYHQHHPVSDPPVEHLDDILRNSAIFARRHETIPMRGWLDAFADRGLVEVHTLRRTDAVRVGSIPAAHPYVDAVTPSTVAGVEQSRVTGWAPDPLLDPETVHRWRDRIDVVHLHFGYDRMSDREMHQWLVELERSAIRLVVTVHDVRNPHHASSDRHDGHLRLLLAAADEVLTLTDAAADELQDRYGRRPFVVPHPTLVDKALSARSDTPGDVLVPLKALRKNVQDPVRLVEAVRKGASEEGVRVRVLVEPSVVEDQRLTGLDRLDVDLDITPYLAHDEVCARVAAACVCVLPYRFGTHSGWIELCRDAGTRVVAPDCGHYAAQWDETIEYVNNERDGLDDESLTKAVSAACAIPAPSPAIRVEREAQRDQVIAIHDAIYRQVSGR